MTIGLASLAKLKLNCLPESLRARTTWDDTLTQIGLAVAAAFDSFCNRTFERAASATYVRPADCSAIVVPRYPLEAVSAAVVRRAGASTDESVADSIANIFPVSGVVEFNALLGTWQDKVTLTYDGGYWWDDSAAQLGVQPGGSTALPKDLEQAWMLQCQAIIERTRILKMGALEVNKEGEYLPGITKAEIIPAVRDILIGYVRHGI